jgi:hypothetical protein
MSGATQAGGQTPGQQAPQAAPGGKGGAQPPQAAQGGKGAGQPTQSPGMKGGAGQPMQPPPGGKGAGQPQKPMPGGKGAGQPMPGQLGGPMPGGKGATVPGYGKQPMTGQAPGGKGGVQPQKPMPGQKGQMDPRAMQQAPGGKGGFNPQQASQNYAAIAQANPNINPAEITDLQGMTPGSPAYNQRISELQSKGVNMLGGGMPPQSPNMPGGKGKGAPQSAAQAQAMQGQAPGGKGGQMDPRMMAAMQAQQANQMAQQQPAHQAFSDQFNVQQGQRGSSPFAPPGTNGSPQAYGQNPNVGGFGFGNGATQVPQMQSPMVGRTPQTSAALPVQNRNVTAAGQVMGVNTPQQMAQWNAMNPQQRLGALG